MLLLITLFCLFVLPALTSLFSADKAVTTELETPTAASVEFKYLTKKIFVGVSLIWINLLCGGFLIIATKLKPMMELATIRNPELGENIQSFQRACIAICFAICTMIWSKLRVGHTVKQAKQNGVYNPNDWFALHADWCFITIMLGNLLTILSLGSVFGLLVLYIEGSILSALGIIICIKGYAKKCQALKASPKPG